MRILWSSGRCLTARTTQRFPGSPYRPPLKRCWPPDLSLRGGRRPTWQSREGTAVRNEPPLNRHAPPICHCEERSDVAISGRHCRSERATVKPACTPDLSLRGAKRRGNLGKALPFSTSHRKTACTPDLSLRGGRRPTWQSREGTPDPYRPPLKQCWPPDLSLRGAKRRGNLGKAPPIRTGRR